MYSNLKGKKILIFGNSGFVGSWLSVALHHFKSKVLGVSLKMNNKNYLSNTKEFYKNIKTLNCDINNLSKISKKIQKFSPEIVVHLASQPIVNEGYKDPLKTFNINLFGTIKIFELVKRIKSIKKVVVFTSDKVYFNNNKRLSELSNLGGLDPYSASKSCQDILSQSYNFSFLNKSMIILRSGNIIGGGDWGINRLIPDIINSIKNRQKVKIRSLNSTRPWLHILDVINGILMVIKRKLDDKKTKIYNLAPRKQNQVSVKKILNLMKKNTSLKSLRISVVKNKIKEKKYLKLTSNKIFKEMGWKSRLDLKDALDLTISLYLIEKNKLFDKTKKQIEDYFN